MNEDLMQARCRTCGGVVDLENVAIPDPTTMDAVMVEPPLPHSTTLEVNGSSLIIEQGWWPARTRVQISPGRIELAHGPLPWPSGRVIVADEIRHLFVERVTRTDGQSFKIKVLLGNGDVVTVVRGCETEVATRYLETRIERHMGLIDRLVGGAAE